MMNSIRKWFSIIAHTAALAATLAACFILLGCNDSVLPNSIDQPPDGEDGGVDAGLAPCDPGTVTDSGLDANGQVIEIDPQAEALWTISDRLVGLHQVYSFVPDRVYEEGTVNDWVRRSGIATSRYPGGTVVKYWDWENPTGQPFVDQYSEAYDPSLDPDQDQWMDLDEYLAFVDDTGIKPHFGVNMASAAKSPPANIASAQRYPLVDEDELIQRAVRMVQYVAAKGHSGAWWYLGNEQTHWHGDGMRGYAKICARFGKAMKAVDPDIKLFWNDNGATRERVVEFLSHDSGIMDGLETHGKWPYGGSADYGVFSVTDWKNNFPLKDYRHNRAWRYVAKSVYRKAAEISGRELLFANNEYGFGKADRFVGFDRFTKGLVMTELLMELFIGRWDMSAFWDMSRNNNKGEDSLLNPLDNYRFNPFHLGMEMLADSQSGEFLSTIPTIDLVREDPTLHGFVARKNGSVIIYLLNKGDVQRAIRLKLNSGVPSTTDVTSMQGSADGYGKRAPLTLSTICSSSDLTLVDLSLPSMSFSKIMLGTHKQ